MSQIKSLKFKDWKNYGKEVGLLIDKLYPLKKDLSRYINLDVKDKYHLNLPNYLFVLPHTIVQTGLELILRIYLKFLRDLKMK